MTEELAQHGETADRTTATGVPAVDSVLEAVESLDGRPLEEHVATFESAHEQLRRALDTADQS